MQSRPGIRQIAPDSVSRLPWLAPPAGYIILIQDVAYGSRYKIARHQQLDRHLIERGADFPFETRVVLIQEATDADAAERDLHDELAPGTAIGEWFDRVHTPQVRPSSPSRHSSVSLGDLARNDEGADSLLEDAEIVETGSQAAARKKPADRQGRSTRRRRRPVARWAIALGLLVLVGVFVAERSGEIRRIIDSVVDRRPAQATSSRSGASPAATVEDEGKILFTTARTRVRTCAWLNCNTVAVLDPGARINAQRYATGQRVNGSDVWIRFRFRGELHYIHSSVVARTWPVVESSPEPSPTVKPTQLPAPVEGRGAVFYLMSNANARLCARMSCGAWAELPLGTRIRALRFVKGQALNGSDRWIKFVHGGKLVYIHSGSLSQDKPEAQPQPTVRTASVGTTFYLTIRARARVCARLSCEVGAIMPRGTAIKAKGYVIGETLDGNNRWVVFDHDGRNLYISRTLVSRLRSNLLPSPQPSPTAERARARPTAVGENEVFYVNAEVRARTCARLTCSEAQLLFPGMKIVSLRYTAGQAIDGNDRWIRFINRGWFQYVHSSYLSREKPAADPTAQPSPTRRPLRDEYASVNDGKIYFVKRGVTAKVRNCAHSDCVEVGALAQGSRVEAKHIVRGQTINGSNEWISFYFDGWYRFVHSDDLFPLKPQLTATTAAADLLTATEPPPTDEPTATDLSPTASPTIAPPETAVVETAGNVNANIRSCPRTSCEIVAKFPVGTEVEILDRVRGETVYETDIWLEIKFEGGRAFLHSELIAEAG